MQKKQSRRTSNLPSWLQAARAAQEDIDTENQKNATKTTVDDPTNSVVNKEMESSGFNQLPPQRYREHVEQAKQKFSEVGFGTISRKAGQKHENGKNVRLHWDGKTIIPGQSITAKIDNKKENSLATRVVDRKKKPLAVPVGLHKKPWRP